MKNWVQFRIARPTDQLTEISKFYGEGLGLKQVGGFHNHDGYDGIMFGLPDVEYHLEFTQHIDGSPCPAPTKDNLHVFYLPDANEIELIKNRLNRMGYHEVEPENPYWLGKSITFEDPDGWRVVLMNTEGLKGK
ncbi:VOC family protein [Gottfriedia luciferensis]|uniref:VOC family protein n=1 Tax=Gottfriedia luciferensis TaxID=178774 RepID=UPI000B434FB3|nr:VOC family protein [Gottfriedia luciferensis]